MQSVRHELGVRHSGGRPADLHCGGARSRPEAHDARDRVVQRLLLLVQCVLHAQRAHGRGCHGGCKVYALQAVHMQCMSVPVMHASLCHPILQCPCLQASSLLLLGIHGADTQGFCLDTLIISECTAKLTDKMAWHPHVSPQGMKRADESSMVTLHTWMDSWSCTSATSPDAGRVRVCGCAGSRGAAWQRAGISGSTWARP
jgi:hypothetical protein